MCYLIMPLSHISPAPWNLRARLPVLQTVLRRVPLPDTWPCPKHSDNSWMARCHLPGDWRWHRGVPYSPSPKSRSGRYRPAQGLQFPSRNLLTRRSAPTTIRRISTQQSLVKYWLRNFNYLSRLAGVHNQLCGSLEIFQGTDIRNRIICLLPVYYWGTDSGSYNQDSNGNPIKQWLWK